MEDVARAARSAGQVLSRAPLRARNAVLLHLSRALRAGAPAILAANAADVAAAAASHADAALASRLLLSAGKLSDLAAGLAQLALLPDPLGVESLRRPLGEGLELRRLSCPIGVLCIIFEARPEAVIQIAALALKSGNALILKGGKEAAHSNAALAAAVAGAIAAANAEEAALADAGGEPSRPADAIPANAVQLVTSRADVAELLKQDAYIDLVIPRGSNQLVRDIKASTRIPVLGHADGVCALYIDAAADLTRAITVAIDSKTSYPAACNSAESLLVHELALPTLFPRLAAALLASGVTLHCDEATLPLAAAARAALASAGAPSGAVEAAAAGDWTREWLSLDLSVRAVASTAAAVDWVNAHGSHHTDVIVTEDAAAAAAFLAGVDSAGVYHNASSRFADGFRYGFGAEVGISTSRIHARGPVGLDGLTTYKYALAGAGHCTAQFAAGARGAATADVGGITLPALRFHHDVEIAAAAAAAAAAAEAEKGAAVADASIA